MSFKRFTLYRGSRRSLTGLFYLVPRLRRALPWVYVGYYPQSSGCWYIIFRLWRCGLNIYWDRPDFR